MKRINIPLLRILLAVAFLAGAGCGGVKPVKVRGIVTLDNKPVESATVTFIPVEQGRDASGATGTDGQFELTTFRTHDGALPGTYKVIVKKERDLKVNWDDYRDPEAGGGKQMMAKWGRNAVMRSKEGLEKVRQQRQKLPKSPIPEIYSDVKKTPLRQMVPADEPIVKVELDSKQ